MSISPLLLPYEPYVVCTSYANLVMPLTSSEFASDVSPSLRRACQTRGRDASRLWRPLCVLGPFTPPSLLYPISSSRYEWLQSQMRTSNGCHGNLKEDTLYDGICLFGAGSCRLLVLAACPCPLTAQAEGPCLRLVVKTIHRRRTA